MQPVTANHHIQYLSPFLHQPAPHTAVQPVMILQVEISLQPWRAFKPDGVILFSDILTPLTGMGIPFDIEAGRGPKIHEPIRTMQVGRSLDPPPPPHNAESAIAATI